MGADKLSFFDWVLVSVAKAAPPFWERFADCIETGPPANEDSYEEDGSVQGDCCLLAIRPKPRRSVGKEMDGTKGEDRDPVIS
jgi:hypothetical protein